MHWLRRYIPPWYTVSDEDVEMIAGAIDTMGPRTEQAVHQVRASRWEYPRPYAVWIVRDLQGGEFIGRPGETRDELLDRYMAAVVPELCRRLRLIRQVLALARRVITVTGMDLRPGKSLPVEGAGRCQHCGRTRHERYDCGGVIVCGDCRYFLRTGKEPARTTAWHGQLSASTRHAQSQLNGRAFPRGARVDEERITTETINRWRRTEIMGQTHYRVLMEIEREEIAQCQDFLT